MRNTKLDVVVVGLVLFITAVSSGKAPAQQPQPTQPQQPSERPRSGASATTRATVRILSGVKVQDGKSSAEGTRSRTKVQDAAGEWQEIEVIDLQ